MENLQIWTRFSFYSMSTLWLLTTIFDFLLEIDAILFMLVALVFSTFVLSIVHLRHFEEKGLPITALVLSSIGVLSFFVGLIIGIVTPI